MNANEHDRRLEEVAAFALGALDAERVDDFKAHLEGCERCQEELRRLAPAVRALPEAVDQQTPPAALKQRLMDEVRDDARAATSRRSLGEWLSGVRVGGLGWKPLVGLAAVVLVVAAGIGYAVDTGGGGTGGVHTWEIESGPGGIEASVVREGDRGELRLTGVAQLPKDKILEAWVKRDGKVEAVPALFAPDRSGEASTTIADMKGVSVVMVTKEPAGGTEAPTTAPIVEVPLES